MISVAVMNICLYALCIGASVHESKRTRCILKIIPQMLAFQTVSAGKGNRVLEGGKQPG